MNQSRYLFLRIMYICIFSLDRWCDRLISYGVSLFLYTLRYYGIGVTERLVQCCVPREIHWYATRTERWCDKGILIHTVLVSVAHYLFLTHTTHGA